MVEARPVRAPKNNDREEALKPKPPKQDKKTLVNMHHPNTYFFKKYAKTLVPVSRVYLMRNAVSNLDEAMKSWKSAQATSKNQDKKGNEESKDASSTSPNEQLKQIIFNEDNKDARLTSEGA